jgi:hypothetical protein
MAAQTEAQKRNCRRRNSPHFGVRAMSNKRGPKRLVALRKKANKFPLVDAGAAVQAFAACAPNDARMIVRRGRPQ